MTRRKLYIDCEVFVMAVRLRRKGVLLPDLERVFGEVLIQIIRMSTFLLLRSPKFCTYKSLFLDSEVQTNLLVPVLEALNCADLRRKPESVVGLLVCTTQNRLRNIARDHTRAVKRGVTICESDFERGFASVPRCRDVNGVLRTMHPTGKVNTQNFEH
jgi:hypothetical protein